MSGANGKSTRGLFGERFAVVALLAMGIALAYVRFGLLPAQEQGDTLEFAFENPMLDARPGERVLFFQPDYPANRSCTVVRPEGVVLRPHKGSDQIAEHTSLRAGLPYLACDIHNVQRGPDTCGGQLSGTVLYALNYFGMPLDTQVRVDSIRPRWMRWEERELAVYEIVFERYGSLGGRWTTYLAREAPVTGLVKWTSLLPNQTTVIFREVVDGPGR
ncbi:MAG: hypothetical protein P1V36_14175 [Planctomycetota bacterium]|nr:hypothetical protein [Planctomycetota bacterium]